MIDSMTSDFRIAARTLVRYKGWTAVAVLTLALGIGANSALFTILNAVLLRPLAFPDSQRIVSISEAYEGSDRSVVASPVLFGWLNQEQSSAESRRTADPAPSCAPRATRKSSAACR